MLDTLPQQKTLPHSEESERAVLGGILLDPAVLPTIAGRLRPDDFYLDRHRVLYEAMLDLQEARVGIDLRTVQAKLEQQLKFDGVGGLAYLAGLDLDLPDIGRIDAYVEIVKERSVRRRLIVAAGQIVRDCLDGGVDAREALGHAEQAILGLGEEAVQRGFVPLANVFHETLEELEERPGSLLTGVPTGFIDLDRISHGLNRGNLIIIAGRPGMGKTSFALNVAQHVAIRERRTVGIFSLEMGQQELALRILCSEADISFSRLRAGRVSQKEWTRIIQTVRANSDSPLYIDDSANPSLLEVASKARRLKAEKGLALLVLDYLQLMQAGGRYENRQLEIAAISRGLKQLAKELDIPVIALSQLSRQPERRGSDHRPQLADLRESGCLTGDTRVTLADTGARVPIGELAGRQGFAVWALDPATLKVRSAVVSHAFATGRKAVFRLTTRLGRSLRATANHRFLTGQGWKRLDELAPGRHIALPRHLPAGGQQSLAGLTRSAQVATGVSQRLLYARIGNAYGGTTLFKQNLSRERALRVAAAVGSEALRLLAESDIYWDQVVGIEADGVEEVFDLTVPGAENFVAEDVFVHNSIEQDADLVAFIYRDEIYNPSDENKGLAELIIAKHRNGETGTVELVFLGDTTSFRNLDRHGGPPAAPF
ncbi:MAG TPA: replicative DNA helicase [Thermoanaerobaculia bacterium]|jgi:replicative DNA helicase|nr:replicative DNA helicase [Thermoanaerobaculia bacterium]